ncbi:MAG: hypothetical protein U1F36_15960 [Planctomycetota bacterium]
MSIDNRESMSGACLRVVLIFVLALLLAIWPIAVVVAYQRLIPIA